MILIIDNYDSFVYNLAQYVGELGWQPAVSRNNKISIDEIELLAPTHIIISPGPCTPLEAGISNEVIWHFGGRIPILGVCLGHQCIGYAYGANVTQSPLPIHGKKTPVYHDRKTIYAGLPQPFDGGRYHSLVVRELESAPELEITATTTGEIIMGIRHKTYNVEGVQFHPESIMTAEGHQLLKNFLKNTSPVR